MPEQTKTTFLNRSELISLSILFAVWRFTLLAVAKAASFFIPYEPSFPYAESYLPSFSLPQWLYSWANFDGVHYLTIFEKGYVGTGLIQAFFPLYPLLTKSLMGIVTNPLLAGLVISNLSTYLLVITWFVFVKTRYPQLPAFPATIILLFFPTSFFFGAVYTESLFLCCVVGSFLAAHHRKWLLAAALAGLASATRVVGVVTILAILVEYGVWFTRTKQASFTDTKALLAILQTKTVLTIMGLLVLGTTGLASYMLYLLQEFGDPLYFLHVQSEFGSGRSESIVLLPQVIWRYLKMLATVKPIGLLYYAVVQEFTLTITSFSLLAIGIKKLPLSEIFFGILVLVIPTLTGTLTSMPRYILACFPIFLLLAHLTKLHRWYFYIYLLGSTVLLILNTVLFIQGYWIA